MQSTSWKRLVVRGFVIVLLFLLLYLLADLLFASLQPLGSPEKLVQPVQEGPQIEPPPRDLSYWQRHLEGPTQPITRTVTITATEASITIDLGLWITATHTLAAAVVGGDVEDDIVPFAQAAFGEIQVTGEELAETEYSPPTWTLDPDTNLLQFHLQGSRAVDRDYFVYITVLIWRYDTAEAVLPKVDEIVVSLDGPRLRSFSPLPDRASQNLLYLRRTADDPIYYVSLSIEPTEISDLPSSQPERISRQTFLQKMGGAIDVPLLSDMLYSLVLALPLLIFLRLVSRHSRRKPQMVTDLATAVGSLLLFHFMLYFLSGGSNLADEFFSERTLAKLSEAIQPFSGGNVHWGDGANLLAVAILGTIVPGMLLQRLGASSQRAMRPLARMIRTSGVLLMLTGVALPVVYVLMSHDGNWFTSLAVPQGILVLFAASLLTLGIWVLLSLLYRTIALQSSIPGLTLLAAFLVLAMGALEAFGSVMDAWKSFVWLVLTSVLGVTLLIALFSACRPLMRSIFPNLVRSRWIFIPLLLLLVGLNALIPWGVDPVLPIVASRFSLQHLASYFDDWIIFAWLAGVVYLLYKTGQRSQRISALPRAIGVLGASSLLFNVSQRWLYIPLTFLIGWLALERWFVQPSSYWNWLRPYFTRVFEERLDLLDQILDLNAAEAAYRQFRKRISERLSSGEVDFQEYDEQLEERRSELNRIREKAKIEGRSSRELALTFGPHRSAWMNGVHGAKYALLFATPWLLIYLRDYLTTPMPRYLHPMLAIATTLLTIVVRWVAYGFFFGFFYPYLRGHNGLQKGFGLFLCAVFPTLPMMAVYRASAEAWQAGMVWVLQVFVHCMLLGLVAFDYSILRQGRYRWQMLFEVHGLTSIGISVSSIAVAIGAAITTMMTTQATNLVTLLLKFVIPEVPDNLLIP